jgi:hypothetical protein
MTPTDIEKINREFATEVMGWHLLNGIGSRWMQEDGTYTDFSDNESNFFHPYFDPYHRIDHAWMGLEKVREHGYYLVLSQNAFSKEWIAKLVNPDNPEKDVRAFDDTGPAAICIACLEAKKEKP